MVLTVNQARVKRPLLLLDRKRPGRRLLSAMRLWSVHPKYLDPAGLVALWREALLARAVLRGATRGYQHHPQLQRFRKARDPVATIDRYLAVVYDESCGRGYHFDASKFVRRRASRPLLVTSGQMEFELSHLRRKLRTRHQGCYQKLRRIATADPHPLFRTKPGKIAEWERP